MGLKSSNRRSASEMSVVHGILLTSEYSLRASSSGLVSCGFGPAGVLFKPAMAVADLVDVMMEAVP